MKLRELGIPKAESNFYYKRNQSIRLINTKPIGAFPKPAIDLDPLGLTLTLHVHACMCESDAIWSVSDLKCGIKLAHSRLKNLATMVIQGTLKWQEYPLNPPAECEHAPALTLVSGSMYVHGGFRAIHSFYRFSLASHRWTSRLSLQTLDCSS